MTDSDYEEEDLDDFMIKASSILSQEKHPERETMIESLKQHLASIFNDNSEMQNFFKTLNGVIFSSSSKKHGPQKITNKQPFKLYPIIFSFNPKTSYFYVDYFLTSLQLCATEQNRPDFPYLSSIFAEVINSFFSDLKKNKNILKKNLLLEPNKKYKLYEKLLNFCNDNIKTNKKTEQSFGCLLLTEFLEKCPLTKEEKNLDNLFKIIADYLDDRWFECKLDLLNCTISLIFTGEKNFKPYANLCLFKVLDYLTDEEWMKRKLAINIVYTLVFYCQEEILSVKDNIIDFLTVLKNDPVDEVREVCLQTLNYIEEVDPNKDKDKDENLEIKSLNLSKKAKNNANKSSNKTYDTIDKGENSFKENTARSNKTPTRIVPKKRNETNLMAKLKKEREKLEKLEQEYNSKRTNFNYSYKTEKIRDSNLAHGHDMNENIINLNEQFGPTLNSILQQLKKIREQQYDLNVMYEDVKKIVDKNYSNINERLKVMESEFDEAES